MLYSSKYAENKNSSTLNTMEEDKLGTLSSTQSGIQMESAPVYEADQGVDNGYTSSMSSSMACDETNRYVSNNDPAPIYDDN